MQIGANPATDLPSVKLFKRLTTIKKEKNELESECQFLKERLDELYSLNQQLEEALRQANDKISRMENSKNVESTEVGGDTVFGIKKHSRRISFDPKFLVHATPD
jgi:predicted nuclease with TOPRIM domain